MKIQPKKEKGYRFKPNVINLREQKTG